ncbi:MAG TPA: class I SAM-dependent methyltransferase [Bacteroidales bacterium]|nr:class I SAM-dependent methyltransferase [Bacteroidales bacterium]
MAKYHIAGFYDFLLYPFLNKTRKQTAKIIHQLYPESLIDICCGTGNQLKYLNHTNIKLTGIDNSPEMLNSGKYFNCHQQDARSIEFPDQSFEMALIQLALHEKSVDDRGKILKEVYRILKNNGYLVIMDYNINHKTSKFAKYIIRIIEFFAGRQHYKHFKTYLNNGGLTKLVDQNRFKTLRTIHLAGNSMVLKIYRKSR